MKTLPSKKLLSATWGSEVTDIDNTTDIKWDMDVLGFWAYNKRGVLKRYYISIHELAHKVKEFIHHKGFYITESDFIVSLRRRSSYDYMLYEATEEEENKGKCFSASRIFKAGEWVLKEISK